jgi:hypothetical protein
MYLIEIVNLGICRAHQPIHDVRGISLARGLEDDKAEAA